MSGEKVGFCKSCSLQSTGNLQCLGPKKEDRSADLQIAIQGGLTVKIVIYSSKRVTCYMPTSALLQPIPAACQQLLQEMPADDHFPVVFSRDGRMGDVKLPWMKNAERMLYPIL